MSYLHKYVLPLGIVVQVASGCGGSDTEPDGVMQQVSAAERIDGWDVSAQTFEANARQSEATTHHYIADAAENSLSVDNSLLLSTVPFDWTISIASDAPFRGRDMKSSDGRFCQRYRSDHVQNHAATPTMYIQLRRNVDNAPDVGYTVFTFPNNGGLYQACWSQHPTGSTYHFDYWLDNRGYTVDGHGTAYH